jgi:tetratricopeptide (TPR) repeat protein
MMSDSAHANLQVAFDEALRRWNRGDRRGALDGLRAALVAWLQVGSTGPQRVSLFGPAELIVAEYLADLAVMCGMSGTADDLLDVMAGVGHHAGSVYHTDYARLTRADLLIQRGELDPARRILEAMHASLGDLRRIEFSEAGLFTWELNRQAWQPLPPDERETLLSRSYLVLGELLSSLGQYSQAVVALKFGLRLPADPRTLAGRARPKLQLALANAYLEQGKLAEAKERLADLGTGSESSLGDRVQRGQLEGKLQLLGGDLGAALDTFRAVQAVCERERLDLAYIGATLDLGQFLVLLNQTLLASAFAQAALAAAEALHEPRLRARAAVVMQLARARARSAEFAAGSAAAVPTPGHNRAGQTPGGAGTEDEPEEPLSSASFLALFENRVLALQLDLDRGAWPEAYRRWIALARSFAATDSSLIRTRLRTLGGMFGYYQGDYDSAARELRAAAAEQRVLGLKADLWQTLRMLSWCLARLGASADEQKEPTDEVELLQTEMAATLPGPQRAVYLLNKWTSEEQYLAGELDSLLEMQAQLQRSRVPRPWLAIQMRRKLYELIEHIDRYKRVVAARHAGATDHRASRSSMPWWWFVATHPRDRATLSFLVLPDRVLVIRVGWLTLDFWVAALGRIELRDLVREWHATITDGQVASGRRDLEAETQSGSGRAPADRERAALAIAQELAEKLGIPAAVRRLPRRVRGLTLVPDDGLHGFPFGAVTIDDAYLVERLALTIGLDHGLERRSRGAGTSSGQGVLVGVSRGAPGVPALLGVKRELEEAERAWSSWNVPVRRLADDAADKATVLEALAGATLVHIACHGVFETDRPDRSGFVLLPHPPERDVLSVRDLSGVDLRRVAHVTATACWSADHFLVPGRWIIGLPEVFLRGGAGSLLGSLWQVEDMVAVSFMRHFYARLASEPRDEALRQAQLELLRERGVRAWAGFTLYGDHGQLTFAGPRGKRH